MMRGKDMDKHIATPITEEVTRDLKAGDYVYLTGTMYVARDAAHKRMIEALDRGEELLYGTVSSQGRTSDRIRRTDHSHPYGQIRSETVGSR